MYAKGTLTVVDRREMLRIKLRSLAAESIIIRQEQTRGRRLADKGRLARARAFGPLQYEMHLHRVGTVRSVSRATHIAYGFIRGKPLEQIEGPSYAAPDWKAIDGMIKKYGTAEALKFAMVQCDNYVAAKRAERPAKVRKPHVTLAERQGVVAEMT